MPPEHSQVLDKEQFVNSGPQSQTLARGIVVPSHVTVKGKEDETKEVTMSMTREQRDCEMSEKVKMKIKHKQHM